MNKTFTLTIFLIIGLISSQLLPILIEKLPNWYFEGVNFATMSLLAFIMIQVGREFDVDLKNKKQYAVDYGVAVTAATFPWIFVSCYFVLFLTPINSTIEPRWVESLLVARFAAPTSAGVLFTMLAASGLNKTWVYRKTRILAIFDDLDTVLLMIPLQILIAGLTWQLGGAFVATFTMLYIGIKYYRKINFPTSWPWILIYSITWALISEWLYVITKTPHSEGMHIEVLLPAFVLGCTLTHTDQEDHLEGLASIIIPSIFMLLVGLSMPSAFGESAQIQMTIDPITLVIHVFFITLLSNLGKMFVLFFYRNEASFKERLATSIAMFPRGEVGAGILAVSLSYGVIGPHIFVAFISLALNLTLTGVFILIVKKLIMTDKG